MLKKIIVSILFMHTFSILNGQVVDIYAHRGIASLAPENTLPAYTQALRIGVDAIDMDINMTKDKVLVVTHDLALNPDLTQDKLGSWVKEQTPIKNLTLKQLKKYTVGHIKPGSTTAKLFPNHRGLDNVHIPTLLEVINYIKANVGNRVRLQIEVKTDPYAPDQSWSAQEIAQALSKVLIETNTVDNVEIQAFEWQVLVDLQKLNPKIKTAYLADHTTEPMNAKQAEQIHNYQKWTNPLDPKDYEYNYPQMVKKLGGTYFEPYQQDITETDIAEAHKLGIKMVVWGSTSWDKTDFDYKKINDLIDWKVDGIITDRADILRGVEASRGLELPPAYPTIPFPTKY